MLASQAAACKIVRPLHRVYELKMRLRFGTQTWVVAHFSPAYRALAVEVNFRGSCVEHYSWIPEEAQQRRADIRITELETQPSSSIRNDALPVHEQLRHFSQRGSQHYSRYSQPQRTAKRAGYPALEL
jgi:hypothetical protein